MKTVFLIQKEMSTPIEDGIVDLFNSRHIGLGSLSYGDSYQAMYELKESLEPTKGKGYFNKKDDEEYWVLPFEPHPQMGSFPSVTVVDKEGLNNFGWDIEVEPI